MRETDLTFNVIVIPPIGGSLPFSYSPYMDTDSKKYVFVVQCLHAKTENKKYRSPVINGKITVSRN